MLVDVLHGETDLLIPMMQERGLPLHPALFDVGSGPKHSSDKDNTVEHVHHRKSDYTNKKRRTNFVKANKKLASLPPDKPRTNKDMKERLEKGFGYMRL